MEKIDVSKEIKSLVEKAEKAATADEAMKWTQAACNAANAMACQNSQVISNAMASR